MIDAIKKYRPTCEQEEKDQALMLDFIRLNNDVLTRDNKAAHMTSSAFVVNKSLDKILFIHHNIYNAWGWVGGHTDGDGDLLAVAIKEAKEETGLKSVVPYCDDIFTLDVIFVSNHIKHGDYVSDHLHLNVAYLLVASEADSLRVKPDENSGVRWFTLDEALSVCDEARMIPLYEKAFAKIRALRNQD